MTAQTTQREPLTRDRVVRAAMDLADEHGLEAVSMRRLGQALGVEAMSLYNHVDNKADLLAGLIDLTIAEYGDLPEGDWKTAVRGYSLSARDVLMRHQWAPALLMQYIEDVGTARLAYMEHLLGAFRDAGFSKRLTHHAFHVVHNHIVGVTMQAVSFPFDDMEEMYDLGKQFLENLDRDRFPHLHEHVEGHIEEDFDDESEFEFGLDLILDGLGRLLDAAGTV